MVTRKAVVRMDRDPETENEVKKLNAKSTTKDKVSWITSCDLV